MSDSQLFTVQPCAIQPLTDGLQCAIYNKASIFQEVRNTLTNKLDPSATDELSEAIYDKLASQLDLTDNTSLCTIGSSNSLQESCYKSLIPAQIMAMLNFNEQILFIRIDNSKTNPSSKPSVQSN